MSKGVSAKTKAVVLKRDRGLCVLRISPDCLGTASVVDHRANRGQGGAKSGVLDRPSNLIAACGICNNYKESNGDRAELERRGVRVRGDSTHEKTAVRALTTAVEYPDGEVWWFDDEGNRHQRPG